MYKIFEELCRKKGVSAYRVSKETGITTATLTSWKQGKYEPKADKLNKIADYFGVSVEYLTTGQEKEQKESPALTAEEKEFLNLFETASPEAREFVISTLKRSIQVSSPRE